MYIRANEDGIITLLSTIENVDCFFYEKEFPKDFLATYSLGKYLFLNKEIVEVEGWVMPIELAVNNYVTEINK